MDLRAAVARLVPDLLPAQALLIEQCPQGVWVRRDLLIAEAARDALKRQPLHPAHQVVRVPVERLAERRDAGVAGLRGRPDQLALLRLLLAVGPVTVVGVLVDELGLR